MAKPASEPQKIKASTDLDLTDRAGYWIESNGKLINALVILVLIGLIAWSGYRWYNNGRIASANRDYGIALERMQTALSEEDESKQKDALQGAISSAQVVATDYPNTFVGRKALLLIGNANFRLAEVSGDDRKSQIDAAQEAYRKYLQIAADPLERASANIALGNALENQMFLTRDNQLAIQAENAYKAALASAGDSYLAGEAKLALARLYQVQEGRREQAEQLYAEVAKAHQPAVRQVPEQRRSTEVSEGTEGQGLNAEQVQEVRDMRKMGYSAMAEAAMQRLPALPTTVQ